MRWPLPTTSSKLMAELLLLRREQQNEITSQRHAIRSLQAQLTTLTLQQSGNLTEEGLEKRVEDLAAYVDKLAARIERYSQIAEEQLTQHTTMCARNYIRQQI